MRQNEFLTAAAPPPAAGADAGRLRRFAADVRESLSRTPRELPSRYLYDPLGSALFDAICELPWYRITRAESRLLASHAAELHARLPPLGAIVELGPGNGEKLRLVLEAGPPEEIDVHLVDLSVRALDTATRTLDVFPNARIRTHVAAYERALYELAGQLHGRTLLLFLGSNIGNFDAPCAAAFLENIRRHLSSGDALLLGTDLVKPERELRLAYDDPLGVTAAFNRNLLVRINRELGGDFDVTQFAHHAQWNPAASRMEMHLVARSRQPVTISAVPMQLTLEKGERIWTESSHKYRPEGVVKMLASAGFRRAVQWVDEEDGFALTLAEAAD
jgi:dimethylhistidine N-methyltransferase